MTFSQARKLWAAVLVGCVGIVLVIDAQRQISSRVAMTQTHFTYAEAYRLSREALAAHTLSTLQNLPESSGAWVSMFKRDVGDNLQFAPEGGPAFVLNKQGSSMTGAIGVTATNFGRDLILSRPAYKHLSPQTTRVRQLEVITQAL